MHAIRRTPFPTAFLLLSGLILSIEAWICLRILPSQDDDRLLAGAVLADLLLVIPGLYYFLEVRRNGRALKTLIPVTLLCLWIATRLLPAEHTAGLKALYWLLPVVELGLLVAVIVTVGRALKQTPKDGNGDLLELTDGSARRVVGDRPVASVLAYELAVLGYALGLRRRAELQAAAASGSFTYHRRTAFGAYTGVLLLLIAAEIFPIHLLLMRWSEPVAWVVFALSVYSGIWLLGDARAVPRRPIHVDAEHLRLRLGLRWSLDVPWDAVQSVERPAPAEAAAKDDLELVTLGAGANLRLDLRRPLTARGPYGLPKTVEHVFFYVDDPAAFQAACEPFLAAGPPAAEAGSVAPEKTGR